MAEDLEKIVRDIVAEKLKISPEQITRESNFIDDLGADSLDTVDMILSLEKRLGKHIPEKDADRMETFGDVIDFLSSEGA